MRLHFAITLPLSLTFGATLAHAAPAPAPAPASCSLLKEHQLRVPAQFPTIQAAVDAAAPGDTVAVAAGTYTESVILQPGVCLLGADPAVTVLDAQGAAQSLVDMSVAPGSTVTGFTFRGTANEAGLCANDPLECAGGSYHAGVFVSGEGVGGNGEPIGTPAPTQASPAAIVGNVFADNEIGVMLNFHGVAVVRDNVFTGNRSALVANHFQDEALVAHNIFLGNTELAIANGAATLDIEHNLLVDSPVAIRFDGVQTGAIRGNVFFHNGADQRDDNTNPPRFTIGQDGNIDARLDPFAR